MAALKHHIHNLSLWQSIACYILAFALLALLLSILTSIGCMAARDAIYAQYPPNGEKYYLTTASGQQLGEGSFISTMPAAYSPQHERLLLILEWLPVLAIPLYSAVCLLAAVLLFYRLTLQIIWTLPFPTKMPMNWGISVVPLKPCVLPFPKATAKCGGRQSSENSSTPLLPMICVHR